MFQRACVLVLSTILPSIEVAAATLARSTGKSVQRLRSSVGRHAEPTPDEPGLFGQPFDVPLLRADTGEVVAHVQMKLAITAPEQHHGLMFKSSMPDDDGMVFLYTNPSKRVLWMKNTLIPLEVGWFTRDGQLQEMHHLHAEDLTYRYSDRNDITMGVEFNEGFFERHGLSEEVQKSGVKLNVPALYSAIASRGFDAAAYLGEQVASTKEKPVAA